VGVRVDKQLDLLARRVALCEPQRERIGVALHFRERHAAHQVLVLLQLFERLAPLQHRLVHEVQLLLQTEGAIQQATAHVLAQAAQHPLALLLALAQFLVVMREKGDEKGLEGCELKDGRLVQIDRCQPRLQRPENAIGALADKHQRR